MGIQATSLSQLLGPTTLRRIYDNELRLPADEDALTLKEVLDTVTDSVWEEIDRPPKASLLSVSRRFRLCVATCNRNTCNACSTLDQLVMVQLP